MIRDLFGGQKATSPRVERSSAPVEAADAAIATAETRAAMPRDALVQKGVESGLENRNLFVTLDEQAVLKLLQGEPLPSWNRFNFEIAPNSESVVVHLSDQGKSALLGQDQALADAVAGRGIKLEAPLKLEVDIDEILLSPEKRAHLIKAYEALVAKGEAPEAIAGQPFQTYFKTFLRGTEDLGQEVELKNFRKAVQGFSQLPVTEQRVRATLGGMLARQWPSSIPGDVRRQMANSMIRHKTFKRPDPRMGPEAAGDLKEFFHGTTMGGLISRVGFRAQPEMLFNQLPKRQQQLLQETLNINFRSMFGPGVYYGNSSVASRYALAKFNWNKPVQVVSGQVALGKTSTSEYDFPKVDSLHVADAPGGEAYYVTKNPKRFAIKGLTTIDPKQTDGLMRYFPQILKAFPDSPTQMGPMIDHLPRAATDRALKEAFKGGDPVTRQSATLLLARRGHPGAVEATMKLLEGPETVKGVQESLMGLLQNIGPGHSERTAPIVEALLKKDASDSRRVVDLYQALGKEIEPIVQRHGIDLRETLERWGTAYVRDTAPKDWKERLIKLSAKGLKRLF